MVTAGFRTVGDTIGHQGIARKTNIVSATCVTDGQACFFPGKTILDQLKRDTTLQRKFNSLLVDDLEELSERMSTTFFKPIDQRIIAALTQIKNKVGVTENNYLAAPITRQDLADMVGARIESVFRALASLKKKKLIEVNKQQIKIQEGEKLIAFIKGAD